MRCADDITPSKKKRRTELPALCWRNRVVMKNTIDGESASRTLRQMVEKIESAKRGPTYCKVGCAADSWLGFVAREHSSKRMHPTISKHLEGYSLKKSDGKFKVRYSRCGEEWKIDQIRAIVVDQHGETVERSLNRDASSGSTMWRVAPLPPDVASAVVDFDMHVYTLVPAPASE